MKFPMLLILFLFTGSPLFSQQFPAHLEGKIQYPSLNFHPYMGVIETSNTALSYNPNLEYKVMIDVYEKIKDSSDINSALREAARVFNLNLANGVPKDNLRFAVVVHGYAVYALLNEEAYQEKYKVSNPNLELIKKMKEEGIQFYVCGQNLGMMNLPQSSITGEVEVALSAKTAIITLDQMGYSYLNVNED